MKKFHGDKWGHREGNGHYRPDTLRSFMGATRQRAPKCQKTGLSFKGHCIQNIVLISHTKILLLIEIGFNLLMFIVFHLLENWKDSHPALQIETSLTAVTSPANYTPCVVLILNTF